MKVALTQPRCVPVSLAIHPFYLICFQFLRETDACNKLVLLMITHKERFFPDALLSSSQAQTNVPKYSSVTLKPNS